MNNLQVKTTELKPAVITFNHEEISRELDATLEKYANLVFTEENTTDLRNTIAEIRKGQNALNRYRIDTKKELNEPANEFDATVKELDKKFDTVLKPLIKQQAEFEETRRKEKRKVVQEIIDEIIEEFELDHLRQEELEIIDSYLTKSKSIKSITDELTSQATLLKAQQDKEKADKDTIETTVKLANAENELSLSVEAYIRLLDYQDVEKVKEQINNDAKKEVEARELAVKRELEKIEREKKQKEEQERLKELAAAEKEKIKQEEKVDQEPLNTPPSDKPIANPFAQEIDTWDVEVDSNSVLGNPFAIKTKPEGLERNLSITCTDDEYIKLIDFLKANDYDWRVFVNENV